MAIPLLASKLVPFASNFLDVLTNSPGEFLLDPSDLIPLTEATNLFLSSQAAVANPEARSGALIKARDDAQRAYYRVARPMYISIQANPDITGQHKVEAGVHVSGAPTPVAVPSDAPKINIVSVTGRTAKARIHSTTIGRAKPSGCTGAYVWSFAGENVPGNLRDWTFWGTTTRTTFEVEFPSSVEPGTKVWLCAGWINTKGQLGPVSDPANAYIQFGGVSATSMRVMKKAA